MTKVLSLLFMLLASCALQGAVPAATVWEVRNGGNDLNGGAYLHVSGGTDRSLSASPHVTFDGATVTASNGGAGDTITVAGYTVLSSDVGNFLQVASGGSNFTTGFYHIIAADTGANTWQLHTNITSGAGSGMVGRMGGAMKTLGAVAAAYNGGNTVWVMADSTYPVTATTTLGTGTTTATNTTPILVIGYGSTRGDGGKPTFQRSSGTGYYVLTVNSGYITVVNFILDATSGSSMGGLQISGPASAANIKVMNPANQGILMSNNRVRIFNAWVTGASANSAFNFNTIGNQCVGCVAEGGTAKGFVIPVASTSAGNVCLYCISANNTGATTDGFHITGTGFFECYGCVAYGNGRDGFRFETAAGNTDVSKIRNSLIVNNTGTGINSVATDRSAINPLAISFDHNGFYGNGAARAGVPAGANDVTLTGSPFTNGASLNFTLNNTAGAGAAAKAVGFPGALQVGGTGYMDLGPLQVQATGGGGGTRTYPIQ